MVLPEVVWNPYISLGHYSIYISFGAKLYKQIVGIPMGTNCAPHVADLFLLSHDRDLIGLRAKRNWNVSLWTNLFCSTNYSAICICTLLGSYQFRNTFWFRYFLYPNGKNDMLYTAQYKLLLG